MSATLPPYWRELIACLPHEWWAWWRGKSLVLQGVLGRAPSAEEIREADARAATDLLRVIDAYDSFMWQSLQVVTGEAGRHVA